METAASPRSFAAAGVRESLMWPMFGWFVRLRLIMTVALAILLAAMHLTLSLLPGALPMALMAVAVAANLLLVEHQPQPERERSVVGVMLVCDVLLLTLIFYLTGGATNPLTAFYFIPVVLSAVVLGWGWTWLMIITCSCCFAGLVRWHLPLEGPAGHIACSGFAFHLMGMAAAFFCVSAGLGMFVVRLVTVIEAHRSAAHQACAEADRFAALAALAAGAAHELRTPLCTIAVLAQELSRSAGTTGPERVREDAAVIRQEVVRCSAVLERLHPDHHRTEGLPATADELLSVTARAYPPGTVVIEAAEPVRADVPAGLLRTALDALIGNALDALSRGGPVYVRADAEPGAVTFQVRDNGPGMHPEVLARVGEPFFTTKPPGQGMGLGFFIVRLLAQRSGGSVAIHSALGTGTVVKLRLPQARC